MCNALKFGARSSTPNPKLHLKPKPQTMPTGKKKKLTANGKKENPIEAVMLGVTLGLYRGD